LRCTIAIFPSVGVQERANSYRMRYDSHYAMIQPHVKLKWPFEVPETDLEMIVKEIESVTKEVSPFSIRFHKIKTFFPTSRVIYMGIQDPTPLTRLHDKLSKQGPLQQEEKYVYIPHLTIGQDMIDDEFHDVYGRLKMLDLNLDSTIDRIHLLYQLGDKTWTAHQTFLLQAKP
jgi:2'-5' RNA ligase